MNLQSTLLFQVFSWEHPQQILGLQPALNFWPWRLWENPEIWRDVFGINHQNSVVLKMHMSNNLNWFHTPSSKMCCFFVFKDGLKPEIGFSFKETCSQPRKRSVYHQELVYLAGIFYPAWAKPWSQVEWGRGVSQLSGRKKAFKNHWTIPWHISGSGFLYIYIYLSIQSSYTFKNCKCITYPKVIAVLIFWALRVIFSWV